MSTVDANALHDELSALRARRRRVVSWTRALITLRWVLLAVLVMVVIDALVVLPAPMRWAALVMGLIGVAGAVWWCRVREGDGARVAFAEAVRLDRSARLAGHPLTTAVELGTVRGGDAFTLALIARAEDRARRALAGVARLPSAERAALRRQGGYLWAVAVVWLVAAVIQPGVIGQGVARLMWPAGATPPFTLTHLTVHVTPDEPTRGEDVRVRVVTAGMRPTTAELVELDEQGGAVDHWPMASTSGGTFDYKLRSLREAVTFRVEAGRARSEPVRIAPREPASVDAADVADVAEPADAFEPADDAQLAPLDAHDRLTDLAQRAATLEELAAELLAMLEGGDANDATAAALKAGVEAGVGDFAADAQAVGESLPTGAAEGESLRAVVEALRLPEVFHGDVDAASAAGAERVRDAAADDRRTLGPWAGEALAGEQVRATDDEPGASPVPATGGTYHHWVQAIERDGVEPPAMMRPVPGAYRDLVRAYFTRVAADERRWRGDGEQE